MGGAEPSLLPVGLWAPRWVCCIQPGTAEKHVEASVPCAVALTWPGGRPSEPYKQIHEGCESLAYRSSKFGGGQRGILEPQNVGVQRNPRDWFQSVHPTCVLCLYFPGHALGHFI